MIAAILIGGIMGLVLLGLPIGFALAIVGVALFFLTGAPLDMLPIILFDGSNNFPLLAIPLFMIVGELMGAVNLSQRLVSFAGSLVGFARGGLAQVTVVTSMIFAEISGSAVAGAAALGGILIPEMEKKGYTKGFAAALVSVAATMAIILPPSIPMILYGVMAGVSVSDLFIAGIFPGLIVAFILTIVNHYFATKNNWEAASTFSLPAVGKTFKEAFWALTIPFIILGGIWGGIFTPTEAAAVASVAAFLIGMFIYKELKLKDLPDLLLRAANQTAVVMIIIAASAVIGWFLTSEQIPQGLAAWVTTITNNPIAVLAILNVFFLVVGMFMHSAAAIIMLIPILMPLIHKLGIDPIHFGIIITINLGIGQQTPPVASVLLTACSVGDVPLVQTFPYLKVYIAVMLGILALITYVPIISTYLPSVM
ncbi:TRAP-type C4-dicarboxylate transport system, large permease component [Desulfosporosinus sp. I2]|uniref:TRAP transporter large permease n=1 Tax=Desulfosporosinus sp. I2 TaxID=1617025 RepID=UPI0005EE95BC|nr:TRAP transporter large permease [Desulfosporosinus sp. I2]KJR48352.1 TRAP-type C4-dicarboxylate transport system, large permease component [Desulfosporosinus sp. I2]